MKWKGVFFFKTKKNWMFLERLKRYEAINRAISLRFDSCLDDKFNVLCPFEV